MYFSLYLYFCFSIFFIDDIISVTVTRIEDLQGQRYANKFVLDHFVLLLLDK